MRTFAKFCHYIAMGLLILAVVFQSLAILANVLEEQSPAHTYGWLLPIWVASLLLLVGAWVLNHSGCEKNGCLIPALVMAAVGTLFALLVTLTLRTELPPTLSESGMVRGLTTWRLLYRHVSSVAGGALLVVSTVVNLIENHRDRLRRENDAYKSVYDLSGASIFKDAEESTLGLEPDPNASPRKLKRSQRVAVRKAEELDGE